MQVKACTDESNVHPVHCKDCSGLLGFQDPQTQGLRLQKLDLSINTPDSSTGKTFTPEQWFSCYLNFVMETQGVRKFVFSSLPYELWVFSTNLAYSALYRPTPTQAMKVLYREREGDEDVDTMKAANLLVETLTLTARLEEMLWECLGKQNELLPESLRKFVGWNVAVLPTFQSEDARIK